MKLFLALPLVANLHAPANAADLLVAAVADDINANATPTQVDFNNQDDKVCMHIFSAVRVRVV